MRIRLCGIVVAAAGALALVPAASADTVIGDATAPPGAARQACDPNTVYAAASSDPTTPYTVPPGGGEITGWSVNTTGASASAAISLVVLTPSASGEYTVDGVDTEALPSPLPAGHVASFTIGTPIVVTGGEVLGLYGASTATCIFHGGGTPAADRLGALGSGFTPSPGETLVPSASDSPGAYVLGVDANLATAPADAAVTASATPGVIPVGGDGLLASIVTQVGPTAPPLTFTDNVPAGLAVVSALSSAGPCSVSGQTVSCALLVGRGGSVPVDIVVAPTAGGTYVNTVSVTLPSGFADTVPVNNTATARVTARPQPPRCVVPRLGGFRLGQARRILHLLGCRVGRVHYLRGTRARRGRVIRATIAPGTIAGLRRVGLVVAGRPPRRRPHRLAHHHSP